MCGSFISRNEWRTPEQIVPRREIRDDDIVLTPRSEENVDGPGASAVPGMEELRPHRAGAVGGGWRNIYQNYGVIQLFN